MCLVAQEQQPTSQLDRLLAGLDELSGTLPDLTSTASWTPARPAPEQRVGGRAVLPSTYAGSALAGYSTGLALALAASLLSASPLVSSAKVASTMASPSTSSKAATPSPTQQRQPRHLKAAMAGADSDLEEGEESKEVRELIAPELTNSRHRLLPSRAAREEK